MTLNEYATKLGLSLNACQIQLLDLIEERKDENLIISFPRLSGRQLMYNLVERKKGYDEGYEQGKADAFQEIAYSDCVKKEEFEILAYNKGKLDGAREFAEWLSEHNYFSGWYKFDGIREVKLTTNEILAEWKKGKE